MPTYQGLSYREFVDPPSYGRAVFSDEAEPVYRYRLERRWSFHRDDDTTALFVMLNPSTATEEVPDPTITRCIRYAQTWGFNRLLVGNLFGLRSTDPKALRSHPDPVGPANDQILADMAREASLVICGWGATVAHWSRRDQQVVRALRRVTGPVCCLGTTKAGYPKHPLRLAKTLAPVVYAP